MIARDFDRLLATWLDEDAGAGTRDYLDETLAGIARIPQRPAWLSAGRWLPMELTMRRPFVPRPLILLAVIALLIVAAIAAALFVGSQRRLPPLLGLATAGAFMFDKGGDLYVVDPGGGNVRPLAAGPGIQHGAAFSPDGTRVVYRSEPGLWVADATGKDPRLVSGPRRIATDRLPGAAWSPDSRVLAFATYGVLYRVNADGTDLRQLGSSAIWHERPTWSPDGTRIAFTSDQPDVYVIDGDGQHETLIVESASAGGWSRDGKQILLGRGAEPDGDVLLATYDGTTWRESALVNGPTDDVFATWSNDGTRLAFLRFQPPNPAQLIVAQVDGSRPRVITDERAGLAFAPPCWSPDDRSIAVLYADPGVAAYGRPEATWHFVASGGFGVLATVPAPNPVGVFACSWQRLAP